MYTNGILPECECFDTGIVRSVELYRRAGINMKSIRPE
jgi:hypothetical protein